jgi:4-carboxymuconolactone decarboxylase
MPRNRRQMFQHAGAALAATVPLMTPPTVSASASVLPPRPPKETSMADTTTSDRYQRGIDTLGSITGSTGDAVVQGLKDIAPDFATWIIAFAYGDVMARPGLDRRSRQIATVAALTALGTAAPQLKVHLHGALNVGCRPSELIEAILQMAVYAGFPSAINGLNVAREVFRERGVMIDGASALP